ncbi:MAG: 6-phosphofructokinase [Bacteroidales bacterium]|nr:6-phosphofructokinase [Bacteroidales bacterium]MBN2817324.1 6-phosphofructokinase [Bacteroidales bacterium]
MANKHLGILTAGGDCPGLNAAIRGIGKTAMSQYDMQVIGFYDGFRGLMENRYVRMDSSFLSGILTLGGTILGTSRDKPNKMQIGGKMMDMTDVIVENYYKHHLDCLVCLGGGGTQKNAYHLMQQGLNVITLPKTIDNDVSGTDVTFGFDTALGIAVEAIDRLHSTASSHHRIIVVEIMGHNTGWLTLGAGIAGGADVILIPEIPYDIEIIAESILERNRAGKHFSIIAVAEGAVSIEAAKKIEILEAKKQKAKEENDQETKKKIKTDLSQYKTKAIGNTMELAMELEKLTMVEARVTILGHLQRGGIPSAADRLLATRLGSACASFIEKEKFGIMVGSKGEGVVAIPLEEVVGKRKMVPVDHPWILSARSVGTSLGDCML